MVCWNFKHPTHKCMLVVKLLLLFVCNFGMVLIAVSMVSFAIWYDIDCNFGMVSLDANYEEWTNNMLNFGIVA